MYGRVGATVAYGGAGATVAYGAAGATHVRRECKKVSYFWFTRYYIIGLIN